MNTSLNHGPATIHQFPVGGRASLGGRRYGEVRSALIPDSKLVTEACSGSWYHEEAVQEAKPVWER